MGNMGAMDSSVSSPISLHNKYENPTEIAAAIHHHQVGLFNTKFRRFLRHELPTFTTTPTTVVYDAKAALAAFSPQFLAIRSETLDVVATMCTQTPGIANRHSQLGHLISGYTPKLLSKIELDQLEVNKNVNILHEIVLFGFHRLGRQLVGSGTMAHGQAWSLVGELVANTYMAIESSDAATFSNLMDF